MQCEHLILQIVSMWDARPPSKKPTKQNSHVPCQWHCELTVRFCMDMWLWRVHLWARGREGVAFKTLWQSRSIATLVHLDRSATKGCSFTLSWLHMAKLITLNRSGGALGVFLLLWQTSLLAAPTIRGDVNAELPFLSLSGCCFILNYLNCAESIIRVWQVNFILKGRENEMASCQFSKLWVHMGETSWRGKKTLL